MGKFIVGKGRFAGKDIAKLPDGSIRVDQAFYTKQQAVPINLDKKRAARRYSFRTATEIGG